MAALRSRSTIFTLLGLVLALGFLVGAEILHPLEHAHDGHDHEGAGSIEQCQTCVLGEETTLALDAELLEASSPPRPLPPTTIGAPDDPAATASIVPRGPPLSA